VTEASIGTEPRWTESRPSSGWLARLDIAELWSYRELAFFLALRDLKLRYKQTVFGVSWAIIQPLAGMVLFSVVFGRLAGLPSEGIPYPVFVFAGLTVWTYLSGAVGSAAESLVEHRDLVSKVYFPRLLAPLAAVLPGLVDFGISLLIVAIVMTFYGVAPGAALVLLPLWAVAMVLIALGAGLWLSALNVLYRDVRYALGFVLQLWFFASPVVFPSSLFEGSWRYVFAANPVVALLDGFRWSLAGTPPPGPEALVSLATGLLLLGGGIVYFRSVERRLADVI
jgi:lipopolysaccharide transport system permease protein